MCDDGWSGASNIATLNASGQELTGDILVGSDSTLTLNLSDSTKFTGNISGSITNNAGTSISTSLGTVKLIGTNQAKVYGAAKLLLTDAAEYRKMAEARSPYGDGHAAQRIVEALLWHHEVSFDRPSEFLG